MKRRAIIFDMDGLMVDTEPLSRQAWQQVLQPYGYALDDATYGRMIGRRTDESAQLALTLFELPLSAAELVRQKETRFDQIRARGVPVMPGLVTLQAAIAARRLPWAVATSSPRYHADVILAQLGLADACQAIAAGDEVTHAKPAPDIYLLAAGRLGVLPAECLALEDSGPGCQAAAAAGIRVIAVPNGATRTADFSMAYAVFPSLQVVAGQLDALLDDHICPETRADKADFR